MQIRLPPCPISAVAARRAVRVVAAVVGLPPTRVEDVCLAVDEAVANAVEAHQREQVDSHLVVGAEAVDGCLEVTVADLGAGFEPMSQEQCDARVANRTADVEGGLGVTLMRALADDITFTHEHGTTVRMRFALSPM